ncbi:MDR family MFS transporter [Oceanobacillus oncorhynchi]|uniref:MDR family MFS transporter n=1 Tax=Oceanobacillus oncorhynchi TaxID=545501 RepID=UPI001868AAD1|nr:MFS transporter [Oceanobacillus oncorhynchi]
MINTIKQLDIGVKVVLLGILIINVGNFMVIPFLSLYLGFIKNLPPAQVGLVLTVSVTFQYGLSFIGGVLSDKFGKKQMLVMGISSRSLGLLLYVFSDTLYLYMMASALIGIGQSFYTPSSKSIIASVPPEIKSEAFAIRSTAVNMGAAFGPILGGLLFKATAAWVFFLSFIIHLVVLSLIIIWVKERKVRVNEQKRNRSIISLMLTVIKDRRITSLMFISSLFWFLFFQLNFTIPIFIRETFNSTSLVSLLFTTNGVIVILLQFRTIKWITKKFRTFTIFLLGMLLMSFAFFVLGIFPAVFSLFVFIFLFTLGEMLFIPSSDTLASDLAEKDLLGGYLGLMTMGWAFGGILGNTVGGYLYENFSDFYSINNLWILYSIIGITISLFLLRIRRFLMGKTEEEESVRNYS